VFIHAVLDGVALKTRSTREFNSLYYFIIHFSQSLIDKGFKKFYRIKYVVVAAE
jgi:hypothetical protein